MKNIVLGSIVPSDGGETAMHITVRGCEVLALFPTEANPQVFQQIRQVLMETCLSNILSNNPSKIGQI